MGLATTGRKADSMTAYNIYGYEVKAGANLAGADLAGADLAGADLSRADLREVNLSGADLRGVRLVETDLSRAVLVGAVLKSQYLLRSDFTCADLAEVDLSGSNLEGSNLEGSNLTEANLDQANLTGVDLTEAVLTDAIVGKVRFSEETVWPVGFVPLVGSTTIQKHLFPWYVTSYPYEYPQPERDERLPLPWVHWPLPSGQFIAFGSGPHSTPVLCECARQAITNWKEFLSMWINDHEDYWMSPRRYLRKVDPLPPSPSQDRPAGWPYFWEVDPLPPSPHPLENLQHLDVAKLLWRLAFPECFGGYDGLGADNWAEAVCHRCTGNLPPEREGRVHLVEYVNQQMLSYGIFGDPIDGAMWSYIPTVKDGYRKNLVDELKAVIGVPGEAVRCNDIRLQLSQLFQGDIAEAFPNARIGRPGSKEHLLASLLREVFPDKELQRNRRPPWLDGLELDIFFPELNLAFEYNGEQHYQPVDFFGGQAAFVDLTKRDRRKAELCQQNGVKLVVVSYTDTLTLERVHQLVKGA